MQVIVYGKLDIAEIVFLKMYFKLVLKFMYFPFRGWMCSPKKWDLFMEHCNRIGWML